MRDHRLLDMDTGIKFNNSCASKQYNPSPI
jgi:hypothetical protein